MTAIKTLRPWKPTAAPSAETRIADLEARQDAVIEQLTELERRIEQTLRQYMPATPKQGESGPLPVTALGASG